MCRLHSLSPNSPWFSVTIAPSDFQLSTTILRINGFHCSCSQHPVYCVNVVGTQNAHNLISVSTDGKMCSWSLDMLSQPQVGCFFTLLLSCWVSGWSQAITELDCLKYWLVSRDKWIRLFKINEKYVLPAKVWHCLTDQGEIYNACRVWLPDISVRDLCCLPVSENITMGPQVDLYTRLPL